MKKMKEIDDYEKLKEARRKETENHLNPVLNEESSMTFWFPKVKDLLPVPATRSLLLSKEEIELLKEFVYGADPCPGELIKLGNKVEQAVSGMSYPLFLRTDNISAKHSWIDTCFVPDEGSLLGHIINIIEDSLGGFMDISFEALYFRQFLDLESSFCAFNGNMPVSKERRYFVRDGKVECKHPYWPPESIRPSYTEKLPEDWKDRLAKLNHETPEEIEHLTQLAEKWPLPGYWSVDFACDKDGNWWFIDAARGELSYHWEDCPYNTSPKERKLSDEDRENLAKSMFISRRPEE